MNLTDDEIFLKDMIKREKFRFNQKIKYPCDTNQLIQEIAINNGWNTQVFQISYEERMLEYVFQ